MSDVWTLEEVDRDGAIQETAEKVDPFTRASFLKKAGLGAIPSLAMGASVPASDVAILNFALTLEYLEAEFYKLAVKNGKLTDQTAKFAQVVASHETAHVSFLKGALGSKAVKEPTFNFGDTTTDQAKFEATATVLEDTGVLAYLGQVGNIKSKAILKAAGSILPVEARHAAWIREIRFASGQATVPAPSAFQGARTKGQILAAVKATGFITG
jgi:hypothetical protein